MVGMVQHKTGSSRRYTESHRMDNHLEWGTSERVVTYVVRNKSISRNFAHCFLRAGNEIPIKP